MTGSTPRIAVYGAGRAGCSFYKNLEMASLRPVALATRSPATARRAGFEGFDVQVGTVADAVRGAEFVFLAVSDDAVQDIARQLAHDVSPGVLVAHLSGSLDLSPLRALADAGAEIGSLHVLLSMATRHTLFANAWAAVDGASDAAVSHLTSIASSLGLCTLHPTGDRARYHAAACLVGNYPQVLMEAAIRLLGDCGVPEADGHRALGALLLNASENAARLSPAEALTGPIARGDVEVVRRHLDAVANAPEVERLYRAGAQLAVQLAGVHHPAHGEKIASLLSESED